MIEFSRKAAVLLGRIIMHAINFGPAATGVKESMQQKYKNESYITKEQQGENKRLHSGQVKKKDTKSSGMIKGGFIKFSFNFPFYIYRIKKK